MTSPGELAMQGPGVNNSVRPLQMYTLSLLLGLGGTRIPSPDPDHHVGSSKLKYRLADKARVRRDAIESGVNELVREGHMLREAVVKKKQRMNLIRILQKSNPSKCLVIEGDMKWVDRRYGLGGETNPACARA
jgi:hypothetical protein